MQQWLTPDLSSPMSQVGWCCLWWFTFAWKIPRIGFNHKQFPPTSHCLDKAPTTTLQRFNFDLEERLYFTLFRKVAQPPLTMTFEWSALSSNKKACLHSTWEHGKDCKIRSTFTFANLLKITSVLLAPSTVRLASIFHRANNIFFMAVILVCECFQTLLDHQKSNTKGGAECAQDPCAQVSELYLLENDTIFNLHRMLGQSFSKTRSQKESSW